MKARIVTLPGDGIGPEVTAAAVAVLQAVAKQYAHDFTFDQQLLGGCAIDATGEPLPAATLAACRHADAVLLGAVGGPQWSDPNAPVRPEQGLLGLRAALGLYANLRPLQLHPALAGLSPLKNARLHDVDVLFVRELTGGMYFGARTRTADAATDECRYTVAEIERVVRRAFVLARGRRKHLTSVDKANVLETSRLWRSTVQRLAAEYPDVKVEHQLVDSMAMLLLTQPGRYDVVVTENLFGDILTDESAALAGSLGLLPSASLGDMQPSSGPAGDLLQQPSSGPAGHLLQQPSSGPAGHLLPPAGEGSSARPAAASAQMGEGSSVRPATTSRQLGLYEPIHGSAPDLAGQDVANPIGAILSAALLLRHSLRLEAEAVAIETAVERVLAHGPHSRDLGGTAGTRAVLDAVLVAFEDVACTSTAFLRWGRACG